MLDPYIGEIQIFAGTFAPRGWALCDGKLLEIYKNTVLFSIIGNQYGGDGRTTFALPDLRDSAPLGQGQGPGLTPRQVGERAGTATVVLTEETMPRHTHQLQGTTEQGSADAPSGAAFGEAPGEGPHEPPVSMYSSLPNAALNPQALERTGSSQPHNNLQPYLGLNFIIALEGIFPNRP